MRRNQDTKKIIVADDEPGITRLVSAYLQRDGYRVFVAQDGEEALDLFYDRNPDLLILDVMMPRLGGFELADEIRKESQVPILFLTARTTEADKIRGFKYGADDYISKPFSPAELMERVKAILRRTIGARQDAPEAFDSDNIHFAGLEISRKYHQCLYGSRVVELSPEQFEILYRLMEEPGRVFTRQQLLGEHSGNGNLGAGRSVDVQIKNIRKSLEEAGVDSSIIVTHRGIGYGMRRE